MLVDIALLTLAFLGHTLLWIGFVNRIHGMAWPVPVINGLMLTAMVCTVLIPVAYVLWLPSAGLSLNSGNGLEAVLRSGLPYLTVCAGSLRPSTLQPGHGAMSCTAPPRRYGPGCPGSHVEVWFYSGESWMSALSMVPIF